MTSNRHVVIVGALSATYVACALLSVRHHAWLPPDAAGYAVMGAERAISAFWCRANVCEAVTAWIDAHTGADE